MSTDFNQVSFFDGYWYCYSNSTAMMLGSIGENISPKLIEPLTGVGLGAVFQQQSGLPFFSGATGEPDKGISKSLEILGFQFIERSKEEGRAPFGELAEILKNSTAVVGPFDMSFLDYNPDRPKNPGVDHFVLVYRIEDDKVFVNDPAGYSRVFIKREQLEKAWRAESIGYKRGFYRYWAKPIKIESPTDQEIYRRAINWFKELYTEADETEKSGALINGKAINYLAELAEKKELKDYQFGFLSGFALPLGVKRAVDYANFFKIYNTELSDLKFKQADLFGEAQSLLTEKDNMGLGRTLKQLASIEDEIRSRVMG